ncbi:MAG: NAD(P)/FAD-dependent oxidoreductase [Candidatus Paracaedibacteraceae bacterium]|nr:NAD(P)/FAD-dependent oxidoreductase [Candidatus Paracaedibacteraceae bacterium]
MSLYDVIIVGGSFAGISAALQLGRARRKVLILDKKSPRNRASRASHGVLGFDGFSPLEILERSHKQLSTYSSVTIKNVEAKKAENLSGKFAIHTADGVEYHASKLILASGVVDQLPPLPGLKEKWGNTVVNCPYCHGYEFKDQRTGIVILHPEQIDMARLLLEWSKDLIIFTNGVEVDNEKISELQAMGGTIEAGLIKGLNGAGETIESVMLEGGKKVNLDILYLNTPVKMANSIALDLGCAIEETKNCSYLKVNHDGLTSIPGVFAAGDLADSSHSVSHAIGNGCRVGIAVSTPK